MLTALIENFKEGQKNQSRNFQDEEKREEKERFLKRCKDFLKEAN